MTRKKSEIYYCMENNILKISVIVSTFKNKKI